MPARARAGAAHFTALLQSVFLLGCVSPCRQQPLSVDAAHMALLTGWSAATFNNDSGMELTAG